MELADPGPATDRDYSRRIGIEIVGQRVELLLPMREAVPRPQPIDLAPPALAGGKPMPGERPRLALGEIARHGFERLGNPLTQLLPPRRQQSLVRDVAEERVLEPEAPAGLRDEVPGAFPLFVEGVSESLARKLTAAVAVPTIGTAARPPATGRSW